MSVSQSIKQQCRYAGKSIALATKHKKADALALPLSAGLGAAVKTIEIDTDIFGTFCGEIERKKTPLLTAREKARLGMRKAKMPCGLASEGSFGSHIGVPFVIANEEVIVFVDDELGIEISESIVTTKTNFAQITIESIHEAESFLLETQFPSHALIARPNQYNANRIEKLLGRFFKKGAFKHIQKGLQTREALMSAVRASARNSADGLVRLETDMRAHMNPTRMRVIRQLGVKLARRLRSTCPECGCPGFGATGVAGALPCQECGQPTESHAYEVSTCQKCHCTKSEKRRDGVIEEQSMHCLFCNP